jgi:hypothetical protein
MKMKKKVVDPIIGFKCKIFKVGVGWSIKFAKCQVFINITH